MFKKDDKVKIIEGNNLLKGKTGIVVEANNNQAKVKINVSEDKDLPRYLINIFENKNLELESLDLLTEDAATFDNDVEPEKKICCICGEEYTGYGNNAEPYKEGYCCDECNKKFVIPDRLNKLRNSKNESLKLTEEELKDWCSDHDANYYTQDIKDDKVIIRGLNEDLAEYDFKTKELKVFDYSGTTSPEELTEEDDDNYIRDYVYDYDILEEAEVASWEFASVIATSENISEDDVITEAHDRGFKVYLIQAANYEKFVVASEKITEDDIMEDFAGYLEGNPKVTEVI